MKQFVFMLSFFLFGHAAFAQIKVSQINSDSLALAFVKEANYSKAESPQWKYFYLTKGDEWNAYYNLTKVQQDKVFETTNYLKWAKADINNDGKEDLIVSGYIARRPGDWATATFKVLLFLSQTGNLYSEQNLLGSQSEKYPAYFNIIDIEGKKYIKLSRWRISENENNKHLPIRIDTLKYNNPIDAIVNYCKKLQQPDVVKIVYKAFDDFAGAYHEAVLENTGKKKVDLSIYTKQSTDDKPQLVKAKLSKNLWLQLDTLSRSIPEMDYKAKHQQQLAKGALPVDLAIYFSDSTKLKLRDYGEENSYTVSAITQLFETVIQHTFDQMADRQQYVNEMMNDFF